MTKRYAGILTATLIALACSTASATDRFFRNKEAKSPSGRYHVSARSPDKQPGGKRRAFQDSFTYTCKDTQSGETIWTRLQAMGEPRQWGDDPNDTYTPQEEGSPVSIYVSDSGWTAIRTGWDELICVDPKGRDTCKIKLLREAIPEADRKAYVHDTTAGPMWSGYSRWYFTDADGRLFFVIRCWWDRRIVIDVAKGELVQVKDDLRQELVKAESSFVLATLKAAAAPDREWDECCDGLWPVLTASHMAGRMGLAEAIPYLRKIEDVDFVGSSGGGSSDYKPKEGGLDPNQNRDLWVRQVTHLSLRRLGEKPGAFANTYVETHFDDYRKESFPDPPTLARPREESADGIRKGMIPEDIVKLLGYPDFIGATGWSTWEYDMDSDPPFSLILHWGEEGVSKIERKPPLWKQGNVRDEAICN